MTTSSAHPEDEASRLDQAIGEYLASVDQQGRAKSRDVRQAILNAYPDLHAELNSYFLDEDGVAGAMAQFAAESDAAIHERVIRYVGSYELLELIGRGGMGEVFRARQTTTGRVVAVKLMRMAAPIERFQREIQIIAKLNHPNIVTLFEAGEDQGEQFYSMEFVSGGSLAERVDVKPQQAAELGLILANTLQYAHEQKILHRDIKPDNILLDDQGRPLLADFGLAKLTQPYADATVTQNVVGTFAYMSPEQAGGQNANLTPACDIYSLGATLYRILCGHPPIQGPNAAQMIRNIQTREPVPPQIINNAIPRDLGLILLKCLQKEPHRRYSSAADLAADLRNFLSGRPISARPVGELERLVRWASRNRAIAGLLGVVMLLLLLLSIGGPLVAWQQASLRADAEQARSAQATALQNEKAARSSAITASEREQTQRQIAETKQAEALRQLYASQIAQADVNLLADVAMTRLAHFATVYDSSDPPSNRFRLPVSVLTNFGYAPLYHGQLGTARRSAAEALFLTPADQRNWEFGYLYRQIQGTPLTLGGYSRMASPYIAQCSAEFSPDGMRIVSGSVDGMIRILDVRTGEELLTIEGHLDQVNVVAFSSDGTKIVSGSEDKTVKVWDAHAGHELLTLRGHEQPVNSIEFSPDGTRIASGSDDWTIRIWHAQTGEELLTLRPPQNGLRVNAISFSPDGKRIVSGGDNHTLKIWDAETGDELRTLTGHLGDPFGIAFSPNGTRIVSGGWDRTLRVWDARTGKEIFAIDAHPFPIYCVAYSPDGSRIVSGSTDLSLKVWDAETGDELRTFLGHTTSPERVAFSPDGSRIVSQGHREVKIWNLYGDNKFKFSEDEESRVLDLAFHPNGMKVLSRCRENYLRIWDAETGHVLTTSAENANWFEALTAAHSPDSKRFVVAGAGGNPQLRDTRTGELLLSLGGNNRENAGASNSQHIWCSEYSPDGSLIVTGQEDGRVIVWNAESGEQLLSIQGHQESVLALTFSPDGSRIVSGGADGAIKIWNAQTGNLLLDIPGRRISDIFGRRIAVNAVAFSPNGSSIAVSGVFARGNLKIFDAQSGEERLYIARHQGYVHCLAYSPDGSRIVSGGRDATIKIWDANSGVLLLTIRGHQQPVTRVWFSPDGGRIVSSDEGGSLRIWDGRTAEEQLTHLSTLHLSEITHLSFNSNGTQIVSASASETGLLNTSDVHTGRLLHLEHLEVWDEKRFLELTGEVKTTHGLMRVESIGSDILLWRKNPDYNPWAEEAAWLERWLPVWHADEADRSEAQGKWFATRFHLRRLVELRPEDQPLRERLKQAELAWEQQAKSSAEVENPPAVPDEE